MKYLNYNIHNLLIIIMFLLVNYDGYSQQNYGGSPISTQDEINILKTEVENLTEENEKLKLEIEKIKAYLKMDK